MAQLIRGLDARRVADNLARVRDEIGREDVQVLAAVKYVAAEEMGVLAEAGITLVGENRAQELELKAAQGGRDDSRGTSSATCRAARSSRSCRSCAGSTRWPATRRSTSWASTRRAGTEVLVEVNVARDESKSGVLPDELDGFLERCPVAVVGLMTMPPFTERPEDSRRWFAALAQLAGERGLRELSMGTSQDYAVAAQEGATIVRLGTSLYT